METSFPSQQVKVYPQTFGFETFSINIGEKSQIFKKITLVAPKLLRKNMGGGGGNEKHSPRPYRVNVQVQIFSVIECIEAPQVTLRGWAKG